MKSGCVVCGSFVAYQDAVVGNKWASFFRYIHIDLGDARVSGVGCYDDDPGMWAVPLDPNERWDDKRPKITQRDYLNVLSRPRITSHELFVIHDACWHLLCQAYEPDHVPLDRLYQVCGSLPLLLMGDIVWWDHGYRRSHLPVGGSSYSPYENPRLRTKPSWRGIQVSSNHDPYDISDLLYTTQISSPGPPISKYSRAFNPDCFFRLPLEVREAIAAMSSTHDALSLRLSSPAFLHIFSSQAFWASRFQPGGELSFIFEVKGMSMDQDWRALYRRCMEPDTLFGLENRIRIWAVIQEIKSYLRLRIGEYVTIPDQISDHLNWRRVTGFVAPSSPGSQQVLRRDYRCRIATKASICLPQNLCQIAISLHQVRNITHVAGLRFIDAEPREEKQLGYIDADREILYTIASLSGFVAAVGPQGIRALQVLHTDGTKSSWFGNPDPAAITERLCLNEPVYAVKVETDGYKVVGLSVTTGPANSSRVAERSHDPWTRDLLWHPEVPNASLHFSKLSSFIEAPAIDGYNPFHWIYFGGPQGTLLPNVTGVSIFWLENIKHIDFRHDKYTFPEGQMKLGDCRDIHTSKYKPMHFAIDGSNGERITSITVADRHADLTNNAHHEVRYPEFLKISTNFGRSIVCGSPPQSQKILEPAPGTVITGLYASYMFCGGITDIGILSTALPSIEKNEQAASSCCDSATGSD